jgi:selenocysteine lyase/cysteine desulfurase
MLAPKTDFIGLEGVAHLAAGGETPMLRRHLAAVARFAEDKGSGMAGRERFWGVRSRACAMLAGMLGLDPGDIALLGSASEGIGQVISSFRWHPGDNVVVGATEFPSGIFGLARLQSLGVELRIVEARGWHLREDDLCSACDQRTKLVYASHVSYLTGQRLDLDRLSAGVRSTGAALLLDATHSLGIVPVAGHLADFVVASGYKWLLATHMGVLAWNRRSRPVFTPLGVGWRSANAGEVPGTYALHDDAARVEAGNPNHLDVYILESALGYLHELRLERVAAHALHWGGVLREGLVQLGLPVITPESAAERAGNICLAHPSGEVVAAQAAEHKLLIWGGEGRVRLSVHCYVTSEDIARALELLPALLGDAGEVSAASETS